MGKKVRRTPLKKSGQPNVHTDFVLLLRDIFLHFQGREYSEDDLREICAAVLRGNKK